MANSDRTILTLRQSAALPVAIVTFFLVTPDGAQAQIQIGRETPPPFEIIYGGKKSDSDASRTAPKQLPATGTAAASRSPQSTSASASGRSSRSRQRTDLNRSADRLIEQSYDAWSRGLMDQSSFATWIEIATTARIRSATRRNDTASLTRALADQSALWSRAVARLEQLQQPASGSWEADLAHSKLMAWRSYLLQSSVSDVQLSARDTQIHTALADAHLALRLRDYRDGLATAHEVINAAIQSDQVLSRSLSDEGTDSASRIALPRFRTTESRTLNTVLRDLEALPYLDHVPLAISLKDVKGHSFLRVASGIANISGIDSDDSSMRAATGQLNRDADEILNAQLTRFQTGTGTPAQMIQTWWLLNSSVAQLPENSAREEFTRNHQNRLEQIHQVALSTTDTRGRNAADITAAQTLLAVSELNGHAREQ